MNVVSFFQTVVEKAVDGYRKYQSSKDYFYYERYKHLGGVRSKIAREYGLVKGNILDLGTGDGFFAMALAKKLKIGEIIGIDRIEKWSKEARENIEAEGLSQKCKSFPIDFWENEFPDNSFDMVATFLAICNLARTQKELDKAVVEFNRILKPGGILLLAEATVEDAENESQKLGFAVQKSLGYHYFSKETIFNSLVKNGFDIPTVHFHKTRSIAFSPEEFKKYLQDEADMGQIDHTVSTGWQRLYRKYHRSVLKHDIEFDAKITVLVSKKKQ